MTGTKTDGRKPLPLTKREREVLALLVAGNTAKEIAAALSISAKTVSVHKVNMTAKLGLASSWGLAKYARDNRLVEVA